MRVALTFNQEEEEVTGKIWEYLEGLPGDLFTGQPDGGRRDSCKETGRWISSAGGGEVDPKHPELISIVE